MRSQRPPSEIPSQARQQAAEGLKLAPDSQGVNVEAALAYATVGDTARAESMAQDLNRKYPLDTQMQALWLPAIQGQIALNQQESEERHRSVAEIHRRPRIRFDLVPQ